jgi:hypothetical protein
LLFPFALRSSWGNVSVLTIVGDHRDGRLGLGELREVDRPRGVLSQLKVSHAASMSSFSTAASFTRRRACHKSYCCCMVSQLSGERPKVFARRSGFVANFSWRRAKLSLSVIYAAKA